MVRKRRLRAVRSDAANLYPEKKNWPANLYNSLKKPALTMARELEVMFVRLYRWFSSSKEKHWIGSGGKIIFILSTGFGSEAEPESGKCE
uniref:Uncharacterized protein n=1 Tax=Vespula pensylvanica TaxID=30213 RepID=A0A834KSH2_VESPE|nr:hypothetical protein H0235_013095 [Vespula pensylvanica]